MSFTHPETIHDEFAAAFASDDLDALVDMYETDALQVAPDGRPHRGHAAIRASLESLIAAGLAMSGAQERAIVVGDIALTSTRYEMPAPTGDDSQRTVAIHTAEVSRRQPDGRWRVVVDSPAFA